MTEMIGPLHLKIARLQQRLKVLALQQDMSAGYPELQQRLAQKQARLQQQLELLLQQRQPKPS